MNDDPSATPDEARLDFALQLTTRTALSRAEPEPFLDWLRQYGLKFFIECGLIPEMPKADWPAVGTALGRAIWNHLPRPDNDFKPNRLPEPGRNDPCPCGSGRKLKQCCGGVGLPPMVFPEELLLPQVLRLLSKKDLPAIPHRRFNPQLLAAIAHDWAERGEADRARLLLEPLFTDQRSLDDRHAEAFDTLMDIYLQLDRPRKRKDLLAIGLNAAHVVLRGTARQRQAAMLLDAGDPAGAWSAFRAAQRDNPQDPSLAALELSLLQGEDRPGELSERARFWAASFKRRPDAAELADSIAMLEGVAADPERFISSFMSHSLPDLAEFAALLAALPAIATPPRIAVLDDGHGVVEDSLADALWAEWEAIYQDADTLPTAWLEAHPQAWDSLAVWDDVLDLVEAIEPNSWIDGHVYAPLYERVSALADAALATLPQPPRQLAWGFVENRAWHRLLLRRAYWLARQGRSEEAMRAAKQLLAWNPMDNLGVRDFLGTGYARAGRYADLLALAERYPGDSAAMQYNHALALYALQRTGEALTALAEAVRVYPKPLKMLLAEHPKPVRPDRFGMELGGDYQAWLYRLTHLDVWRDCGALDWARQCAPALKRRTR